MAKTTNTATKTKAAANKKVLQPIRRRIQFCIDFAPFPDKTVLGPNFTLAGFDFTQNPGGLDMLVHTHGGEKGLRFPKQGMRVKLPMAAPSVTMRVGDFGGPFDVVALDAAGAQVAARTVQFGNAYGNVTMTSGARPIVALDFKGGNNEASLVRLCIRLECAAP